MSKRATIRIDRKHSVELALGNPVTIKVPRDTTELTIECCAVVEPVCESRLAEIIDVFFNGRAARA